MVSCKALAALAAQVLLATLPLHVQAGLYAKNSPVLQLNSKNYDRLIAQSNYTSIVEFYAPWCGHCKSLQPAYEKAAKALAGLAKVGAVDCDDAANKAFCGSMGVQGFPTLKIVKPGKQAGRPLVEDYQGQRTAKAIVETVSNRIPNLVKRVQDKELESFLAAKSPEGEGTSHKAILFSDKGKTSSLLKAVAIDFKGSIAVAQIRSSEKASVELFEVSNFPSLVLLPAGEKSEKEIYNGDMNKEVMVKFLSQVTEPNPDPAPPRVKIQGKDKKETSVKDKAQSSKDKQNFEQASASHASSEKPITATDETLEDNTAIPTESPSPEVDTEKPLVLPDPAPAIQTLETEDLLMQKCLGPRTGTCILAFIPAEPNAQSRVALNALAEITHKFRLAKRPIFPFYAVPSTNGAARLFRDEMAFKDDSQVEIVAISGRWGWWRHIPGEEYYISGEKTEKAVLDEATAKINAWVDKIRLGDGWKKYLPAKLMPEYERTPGSDGEVEVEDAVDDATPPAPEAVPVPSAETETDSGEPPEPETPEEPSADVKHGEL